MVKNINHEELFRVKEFGEYKILCPLKKFDFKNLESATYKLEILCAKQI